MCCFNCGKDFDDYDWVVSFSLSRFLGGASQGEMLFCQECFLEVAGEEYLKTLHDSQLLMENSRIKAQNGKYSDRGAPAIRGWSDTPVCPPWPGEHDDT